MRLLGFEDVEEVYNFNEKTLPQDSVEERSRKNVKRAQYLLKIKEGIQEKKDARGRATS